MVLCQYQNVVLPIVKANATIERVYQLSYGYAALHDSGPGFKVNITLNQLLGHNLFDSVHI